MDDGIFIHKKDECYLQIMCPSNIGHIIKKNYECFAPGYRFHPLYRNPRKRIWNGKISVLNLKTRLFPSGLLDNLTKFLDEQGIGYTYDFKADELKNYEINDAFLTQLYSIIFNDSKYYPRDYQHTAVKELLYNKKAMVEEATGSGKSLVIYCLIRYLLMKGKRIVLVVPNIMLVEQMRSDFKDYGWVDCDNWLTIMYQNHVPDIEKPVLISTYQSLILKDDSFIMRYNAAIIDEVHQAPADSIKTIRTKLVYADYCMGMTGTLPDHENKDEQYKLYDIFGYVGPMVAQKMAHELMEEGYLSKVKIAAMIIKYPEDMCLLNRGRPYPEERRTIIETHQRNKIFNYIFANIPPEENTLILCELLEHLDLIYEHVNTAFGHQFQIRKISGAVKAKDRLETKELAEAESGVVIVATYGTMSVGVNIKKLHNVVLASSYKSKIRILQTIGRGLRLHETKEWLTVFDIADDLRWKKRTGRIGLNHTWKQFVERLQHYRNQKYEYITKIIKLEEL